MFAFQCPVFLNFLGFIYFLFSCATLHRVFSGWWLSVLTICLYKLKLFASVAPVSFRPTLEDKLRALWNVIHALPEGNRINLRYLIKFLAKVSSFSEYNRMNPANLSIVFGPNLLKPNNNSG